MYIYRIEQRIKVSNQNENENERVTLEMVNELYHHTHSIALFARIRLAAHHLQCNFIQSQCVREKRNKYATTIALNKNTK